MSLAVKLGGTQNKAWAENKSRFGFKLLEKMGWEEGKGLGKNNSGQLTHVQVKKKGDTLGLGVDDSNLANKHFLSAATSYTEVLKQLNKKHSEERKMVEESKSKKRKISIDDGEEEKRVYNKEDLTVITGTPREYQEEEEELTKIGTNSNSITVSEEMKVEQTEKVLEKKNEKGMKDKKKKKEEKKEKKDKEKHKKHHHRHHQSKEL